MYFDFANWYLRTPRRRRVTGAERGSRVTQGGLNVHCDWVRSTEHAPRDPCRLLERRHGFVEIVERGGGVVVDILRVYAQALVKAQGANLDESEALNDLREAMTTLEETEPIARRVFGGAHPTTVLIETNLRAARAAILDERETNNNAAAEALCSGLAW